VPQIPSPAIGEYQQQSSVADPFRRITPHEEIGTAGLVGASVGALAGDVEQAQHNQGVMYSQEALAKMQGSWTQKLEDAKQNAPAGAPNFTADILDKFDKDASAAVEDAPAGPGRKFVNEAMLRLRNEVQARALSYETVARTQHDNFTMQQSNDAASNELTLHPEVFTQRLAERRALIGQMAMSGNAKEEWQARTQQELATAAAQGLIKQDPLAAMQDLQSDSPKNLAIASLDPKARQALLTEAKGQYVTQKAASIVDTYRTGGAQAGTAALAGIDKDTTIPPELRDDVRRGVNQGVNQLREDSQQQNVGSITALHERLAKGEATDADRAVAWGLYHRNALSPMELSSTLAGIDRSLVQAAGNSVTQASILDAYTNQKPLDPKDKDVQKAVGDFFTAQTKGVEPGTAQYSNYAAAIAGRTGVVPEPAMAWARATLDSGDPKSAAAAADMVSKLHERNPRALGYADDDKRITAMADTVNTMVRAGTDPNTAVTIARQNIDKAEDKGLERKWTEIKADKSQPSALADRLKSDDAFKPHFYSGLPDVPIQMQADYDAATKEYFNYTNGNIKQARDLAAKDIKRVWGVSEVNGQREIMAYPPEQMFPGLTPQVIREDLANSVKDSPAFKEGQKAADIRLIPTDHTARTGGLEWALGQKDEFGAYDIVRDSRGAPITYRLPVNAVDYGAVQERARQAQLAKLKDIQSQREAARAAEPQLMEQAAQTGMVF